MKKCKSCGSTKTTYQWYKGPRCAKCYQSNHYKTPHRKFGANHKRWRAIQAAKKRKVIFEIDLENYKLIINRGCFYCGKDVNKETGSSLDRVNPNKGYIKSNVVPCCGNCNMFKHSILNLTETRFLIEKLKEFRKTKGSPWI